MIYFGYFGINTHTIIKKWTKIASQFLEDENVAIKLVDEQFAYSVFDENHIINENLTSFIDGFALCNGYRINLSNFNSKICDELLHCKSKELSISGSFTAFRKYQDNLEFINDYYSTRPLYYYLSEKNELFFSNDISMLILIDEIPFSVNEFACKLYCSSWFTVEENSLGEYTFFEKIKKVPPSSIVNFDGKKLSIIDYYNLKNIASIEYSKILDKSHHNDKFRKTLDEITFSAFKSTNSTEIGVSLSGGIDSSAVLGSLISSGLKDNVNCYHLAFKDSSLYHVSDHKIVKELVKHTKVKGYIIWGDEALKINNCKLGRDPIINVNGPCCISNEPFYHKISDIMRENNAKILFGGDGGDYLFMGTRYCGDYYLKNKNFREAIKRALYFSNSKSWLSKFDSIFNHNILPFIPLLSSRKYLKIYWEEVFNKLKTPYYIGESIHDIDNQWQTQKFKRFNKSKVLKYWYRRFIYDFMFPKGEYVDVQLNNIQICQPLMDNQIFLQAITVPPNLHYDIYNKNKSDYFKRKQFLRQSYKDILPYCIVNQAEKTNYSAMIGATLRNERKPLAALFNSSNHLITDELGIIKKQAFCNKIKHVLNYAEDPHYFSNEETNYYMNVIKLEIWLQMINKGRKFLLKTLKKSRSTKSNLNNIDLIT